MKLELSERPYREAKCRCSGGHDGVPGPAVWQVASAGSIGVGG